MLCAVVSYLKERECTIQSKQTFIICLVMKNTTSKFIHQLIRVGYTYGIYPVSFGQFDQKQKLIKLLVKYLFIIGVSYACLVPAANHIIRIK